MQRKIIIPIIIFVSGTLGLFLFRIYSYQYISITSNITVYQEQVGGGVFSTGCFNKCAAKSYLLFCGPEDKIFNTFGKKCFYLCPGDFYNNCSR